MLKKKQFHKCYIHTQFSILQCENVRRRTSSVFRVGLQAQPWQPILLNTLSQNWSSVITPFVKLFRNETCVYKNSKCQRLQLSLSNVSLILYKQVNGWHSWRIWSVSKIRFWKANNLDSSATLLGTPVKLRVKANF